MLVLKRLVRCFLKFWYVFAEHRYLVPIIVCVNLGWWWLFGSFCLMYLVDLEPIRSRWESGKCSYLAHVFRHGVMLKLLEVLVWFTIAKDYKFIFIFFLIYLFWLSTMAFQVKKPFGLTEVQAGIYLSLLGISSACFILPFCYEMNSLNFAASFALVFEFILIIRHLVQYQPGLKAPARPR